jgi:hypothetical protein
LISNLYDLPRELASRTRMNPCPTVGEVRFLDADDMGCCSPGKYVQKPSFSCIRGGFQSLQPQTSHMGNDVQRWILKVYIEIQIKVCPGCYLNSG